MPLYLLAVPPVDCGNCNPTYLKGDLVDEDRLDSCLTRLQEAP